MTRVDTLRQELSSLDPRRRRQAIFAIVKEDAKELSGCILSIFRRDASSAIRGLCAWALGKLHCKEAYPDLVNGMEADDPEVRSWSAWALGEIGLSDGVNPLEHAMENEPNPLVRRAIGGALKKLRDEPTREHVSTVIRRLRPPPTDNERTQFIVENLASLQWPLEKGAIVELRRKLQEIDPIYFGLYMEWLRRKPSIERALLNPKKVYSDFE